MGNVYKQKGSIVLYKEERNGTDYIRIEYANSPTVALLLAYDEGIETTGSGWALPMLSLIIIRSIPYISYSNRILFLLLNRKKLLKLRIFREI